jgi:streptomycin 6-kinase
VASDDASLAELAERWSLTLGETLGRGAAGVAVEARLADGGDAVLKLAQPHRESEHEAAALARWAGVGAVRLLAHDPPSGALLLERCRPGTPLSQLDPEPALDVLVRLLPRLWVPVAAEAPFRSLAEEAAWWRSTLEPDWERAGRPYERELLDAALAALRELPPSQGEQVLVNQDLHAGNVLRAEREPWLVIDPKPLVGERAFGIAALIRGRELGDSERALRRRFDRLTAELGLDRDRARGWALAQTLAWARGAHGYLRDHVETARRLLRLPV